MKEKQVRALVNQMTNNLSFRLPTSPTGITMKHDDVKWEILKANLKPETKLSLHHLNDIIRDAMVIIQDNIVSKEADKQMKKIKILSDDYEENQNFREEINKAMVNIQDNVVSTEQNQEKTDV